MHKLSGILIAVSAIAAFAMLFVMTGCKQNVTPSPKITQLEFPYGADVTPMPDGAKRAAETTPPTPTTVPPQKLATAPKTSATPATPATPPPPSKPAKPIKPVVKDGHYTAPTDAEVAAAKKGGTRKAIITTEEGVIVAELYGADEPLTVANFIKLANAHFYDGLAFHRVETDPKFALIQGGDPQGTGSGPGPGYTIKLEVSPKHTHDPGALAMARTSDPNSANCQFYITTGATHQIDGQYAVFGKVIKNLDVAKKIGVGDKILSITIQ